MGKSSLIFGIRSVSEALHSGHSIEHIYFLKGKSNNESIKDIRSRAHSLGIPYSYVLSKKFFTSQAGPIHQGVLCVLSTIPYAVPEELINTSYENGLDPLFLIVDQVTDVRNFGALTRSAECAGVTGIIVNSSGQASLTGDAMKTSAGALNYVPVCRTQTMTETITQLQNNGIRVVACTEKAKLSIYEVDLTGPLALIVGSEEKGISSSLLKRADELVAIPLRGKINSLNVSVAGGIALFETIRQRAHK